MLKNEGLVKMFSSSCRSDKLCSYSLILDLWNKRLNYHFELCYLGSSLQIILMDKIYWYNSNSLNISGRITDSIWSKQNK